MAWLMEQDEGDDQVAQLARLLFKDYNNGCLPMLNNVRKVLLHYIDKHPARVPEIRDLFVVAIRAYDKEIGK